MGLFILPFFLFSQKALTLLIIYDNDFLRFSLSLLALAQRSVFLCSSANPYMCSHVYWHRSRVVLCSTGVQVRSWLALANLTLEKLIPAKTDSNDPSSNPLHVWHALTQASRISHQITGSSSSQGSDLSLRARAWNLYGHQELSKLSSEALLTHHTNTGSSLDMSLALANLAQIADIHGVHNLSSSILEASQARYPFHGEGAAEVAFSLRFKAAADKKDLTGAKRIARNWFALSQTHAASQPYVVQMLFAEARSILLSPLYFSVSLSLCVYILSFIQPKIYVLICDM